jgi:calcium-dependent protein kinase
VDQIMSTSCGSAYYVAPEVLRKAYNKSCDVWSLGVIVYIMLCGQPPFYAATEREMFKRIKLQPLKFPNRQWQAISQDAVGFVTQLLTRDVVDRASIPAALQHEWMLKQSGGQVPDTVIDNAVIRSLNRFTRMGRLKREALKKIADGLEESDEALVAHLRVQFDNIDRDRSGSITTDELADFQADIVRRRSSSAGASDAAQTPPAASADVTGKEAGSPAKGGMAATAQSDLSPVPELKDADELMGALDQDGSDEIDFHEFLAATISKEIYKDETRIKKAFDHFGK